MRTKEELLKQANLYHDAIRNGEFSRFEAEYSWIMRAILETLIDIRDIMGQKEIDGKINKIKGRQE